MMRHLIVLGASIIVCACSGEDGQPGPMGEKGEQGPQGAVGPKGDKGDAGEPGPEGDRGPAGPAGKDGADGTDGAQGEPGPAGENGADGSDAEATRVIESFFCAGGLEDTALSFTYDAILLSSGDLFVNATIRDARYVGAGSSFYAPEQNGYQGAQVIVGIDEDATADFGWFRLTLNRDTLVVLLEYRESDAAAVTQSWTMQPSACVHNKY
jgi:hypothetical protein